MPADSTARSVVTVCVCICTFRRPELLKRTLEKISQQDTRGTLAIRVVVADNDCEQSARGVAADFQARTSLDIVYCVEPEQNIALARNRALQHADGEFVAFIDDDEFPGPDWLLQMHSTCEAYSAAGVLAPVRPFFDSEPPEWLLRSRLCERTEHATGTTLGWKQTRTGNVLLRRSILQGLAPPFRQEFGNGGEDQDFFRRMMLLGHRFVWCNEAAVYEFVPPERRRRSYYLKRALMRGQNEKLLLTARSIAKSLVAVPIYITMVPFLLLLGQHHAMRYGVKLFDHAGKLLTAVGIRPIRGKYLS